MSLHAKLIGIFLIVGAGTAAIVDSLWQQYQDAVETWDRTEFFAVLERADSVLTRKTETPHELLHLKARVYWRLQLFTFVEEDPKKRLTYGDKALTALQKARKLSGNPRLGAVTQARVYQMMASTGWQNGAMYGPKTQNVIESLKETDPDSYFARLLESTNLLAMPSFVGGDPKQARETLKNMISEYPDSLELRVQYGLALNKTGKKDSAKVVLQRILEENPAHRLARYYLSEM